MPSLELQQPQMTLIHLLETSLDHTLQALKLEIGGIRVGNHYTARQIHTRSDPTFRKSRSGRWAQFPKSADYRGLDCKG